MYKNIEEIITKETPESGTIHFEASWQPNAIYRSICAFANDYFNLGGGYFIVGAAKEKERIKRPVTGLDKKRIPAIIEATEAYNEKFCQRIVQRIPSKSLMASF